MKQGFYTAITPTEASTYMCALGMSVISVAEGKLAMEYYFLRNFLVLTFHYSSPIASPKKQQTGFVINDTVVYRYFQGQCKWFWPKVVSVSGSCEMLALTKIQNYSTSRIIDSGYVSPTLT